MLDNPLIKRYSCSSLRPKQVWVYAIIYTSVIALMLFINYTVYEFQEENFGPQMPLAQSLYYQFLIFQIIILWAWSSHNSNSAIKEEVLDKSYDFFRMLPMPAWQKAVGILIGKNLLALLFASINFIFLFIFGISGKINFILQLQIFLLLISVASLANLAALLTSLTSVPQKKNTGMLVFIFLLFFVVPPLIGSVFALSETENLQSNTVPFYSLPVPILLMISFNVLYFSLWVFKGVIRKFNHEHEPLFNKKGAFLFMLGFELIVIGFFINYLSDIDIIGITYSLWAATIIPAALILIGSLITMDKYIEHSRAIQLKGGRLTSMFLHSNLSTGLGLFAIWASCAFFMLIAADDQLLPSIYRALIFFSFYLFFIMMAELYVIYNTPNSKVTWLIVFIFILHLILPLILSGAMDEEFLLCLSPFGYWGCLVNELGTGSDMTLHPTILIFNLVLCIIPAIIVCRQYALVIATRKNIDA